MEKESYYEYDMLVNKLEEYDNITIFGITDLALFIAYALKNDNKKVRFFDNDTEKQNKEVLPGVFCYKPVADSFGETYVITLKDEDNIKDVTEQIESFGHNRIILYCDSEWGDMEKKVDDKTYLQLMWFRKMGYELDLDHPCTFNEKLQWLKLYDRDPLYTTMVDKLAAKQYVAGILGEEYVIPSIGWWNSFEEIPFKDLPNEFVLKCTHDSGTIMLCKDKSLFDFEGAKKLFTTRLKRNYYYPNREWPYKNVKPRILAEKLITTHDENPLIVYKFLCFNGIPKVVQVIQNDKQKDESIDYFDCSWKHLELKQNFPNSKILPLKPKSLSKMIEIAKEFSRDKRHIRVDFYEVDEKPVFSEFTFYSDAGFSKFEPDCWDRVIGEWISL